MDKERKIAFYTLVKDMWANNADGLEGLIPFYEIKEVFNYIDGRKRRSLKLKSNKACSLESFSMKQDSKDSSILITGLFKSAAYKYRPPYWDTETDEERESPKKQTEGEKEKTHFAIKITNDEVFLLVEVNGNGVSVNNIISYLNQFTREYLKKKKKTKNFTVEYTKIARDNFISELEKLKRATSIDVFFNKSLLKDSANPPLTNVLTDSISQIVSACPGEIGVAVIVNNRDTVKVNNKSVYPMMSVFKVHQALALCNDFDNKGISLDTLVNINRDKLDPKTWSPMLKDYSGPVISLTVRDLLRYTLTQSDNNASNLMFKDMVNVAQTDSFIATLIPRSSFQIAYTEEEMSADHNKAYSNYTSPLGAAMLMNRLFTEGLIDDEKQSFIKNTLKECKTGVDRIAAPLLDKEGVVIAHKTGSGDVNENGVLAAHNDVAYICLPNNISYTLAVFVKDFKGNESQASQYVAHISAVVYSLLMQTSVKS